VTSIADVLRLDAPMDFIAGVRDILADDGVWVLSRATCPP